MKESSLTLLIEPKPQARPRARAIRDKNGRIYARAYTDPKAKENEDDFFYLAYQAPQRPEKPWEGPLQVTIKAVFTRPMSAKKDVNYHVVKPDVDNLVKFALDGLQRAGYFRDDKQVQEIMASKCYENHWSSRSLRPGWYITIREIERN
jgi:Holliday junction resolvase RusA-like endonuclease